MRKLMLPTLAFFDVETTGLSAEHGDRVCEVAVLKTGAQGETAWHSLVNPGRPISPGALAVNGITDDMVRSAPCFGDIADRLLALLDGAVLVCHNARFDVSFLSAELGACGRRLPRLSVIDTLFLARRYFTFPSNSLSNIAAYLNIDVTEKHRAFADVRTTHAVFTHFIDTLSRQGLNYIEELFIAYGTERTAKRPGLPPLLEEAIRTKRNVALRYLSRFGAETRRLVRPLRIITRFDYLYLEAFCTMRKERRTFRLDRIVGIDVLPS